MGIMSAVHNCLTSAQYVDSTTMCVSVSCRVCTSARLRSFTILDFLLLTVKSANTRIFARLNAVSTSSIVVNAFDTIMVVNFHSVLRLWFCTVFSASDCVLKRGQTYPGVLCAFHSVLLASDHSVTHFFEFLFSLVLGIHQR